MTPTKQETLLCVTIQVFLQKDLPFHVSNSFVYVEKAKFLQTLPKCPSLFMNYVKRLECPTSKVKENVTWNLVGTISQEIIEDFLAQNPHFHWGRTGEIMGEEAHCHMFEVQVFWDCLTDVKGGLQTTTWALPSPTGCLCHKFSHTFGIYPPTHLLLKIFSSL